MTDAIVCRGIIKRFGDVAALDGFDLTVPAGSIVSLVGPSGSGKTTALRVMAGFERPEAGEVRIAGDTVVGGDRFAPPERRRVGMVFQDFALFPHLTVGGNVGYGLPRAQRPARVPEVLAMVGLGGMERRMPHELSGGEQQRVALARALAPSPAVVLLDEPFSNLDAPQRDKVRREVRGILVEARASAVFVTHDQEEALALSDVVAVMQRGRIAQVAPPHDLYRRPADRWVAGFLGDAEFVPGTAAAGRVTTAVGDFPAGDATGPVEVMIRPETVRLTPDPDGPALVVEREFYGHDQLVTLFVDGSHRLLARCGSQPIYQPGDRVRYEVGDVVVFPAG